MKSVFKIRNLKKPIPVIEEGQMVFGDVETAMCLLYKEHAGRPFPEAFNVHLLAESIARLFDEHLTVQHGYVNHLFMHEEERKEGTALHFSNKWHQVSLLIVRLRGGPKKGFLNRIPTSWLFHEPTGMIIDILPVGGELGFDKPVRHPNHPDRLPHHHDPEMPELKGKLPTKERINELWEVFERLAAQPKHRKRS